MWGIVGAPLALAKGVVSFTRDVGTIARVAREAEPVIREVEPIVRDNSTTAREALDVARENNALTRQANATIATLDLHATELLRRVGTIELELPAIRRGLAHVEDLADSAETLSVAAPPVQAAAERVERLAQRIPGARRSTRRLNGRDA